MKFLITGATGFIGSYIIEELHKTNQPFKALTFRNAGTRKHITHILNEDNLIQGDISDPDFIGGVVSDYKPDVIINMASLLSFECSENPQNAVKINILGLMNLLEAGRKNGVQRIINASSCATYINGRGAMHEKRHISPDINLYGACKFFSEILCRQYSENYNLEITNLRYFDVYGPSEAGPSLYARDIKKIESISSGKNVRIDCFHRKFRMDFINVRDAAQATILAAKAKSPLSQVYNIAGKLEDSVTMSEFVSVIKSIEPQSGDVIFNENIDNKDTYLGVPDTSLATKELSFEPAYTLKRGLLEYIHS